MRILTDKKLEQIRRQAYEEGLNRGYQLGKRMQQVEDSNRQRIISYELFRQRN